MSQRIITIHPRWRSKLCKQHALVVAIKRTVTNARQFLALGVVETIDGRRSVHRLRVLGCQLCWSHRLQLSRLKVISLVQEQ